MRFHEFYKFENGKVAEIQSIWDIPEVMMQANSWPMAPRWGEYHIPGQPLDGILEGPWNKEKSNRSCSLIVEMLEHMKLHQALVVLKLWKWKSFGIQMNWYG